MKEINNRGSRFVVLFFSIFDFCRHSNGNASDQKVLIEATKKIEKCCESLAAAPSFTYVGDSAMYESCLKKDNNISWISRVPMKRKEAKKFVEEHNKYQFQKTSKPGYKVYSQEKTIAGIKQRWVLVYSEKAFARAKKTLEKQKIKAFTEIKKELKRLSKQVFNCEEDAKKALKKISKKWVYYQINDVELIALKKYPAKGKPKKDAQKQTIGYNIKATIEENTIKINEIFQRKGHFILATNQLNKKELSDEEVLLQYKNQQKVEKGFAFIKSKTFQVSSVFLKKENRISALMAVMVLSLFVYSLIQHLLRTTLKEKGKYVPNQLDKPTQTPTARWIFFLFQSISVLYIDDASYIKRSNPPNRGSIINLDPLLEQLIRYFGPEVMSAYDIPVQ